uniref:hypothetical protein n=1 Tax=Novosphingobium sp. MBES04 TaxID=1206458 RepID=UPI0030EE476E
MIELTHGVGVQIDELAGNVDGDKLAKAMAVVDEARDQTLDQQGADLDRGSRRNNDLSTFDLADFCNRGFKQSPVFQTEVDIATIGKKGIH